MREARLPIDVSDRNQIEAWLREEDEARLDSLWRAADETRRAHLGDAVYLRGLIEVSNHCVRQCHYCGIRGGNRDVIRYRMSEAEILDCARAAARFGYGTVVLQAGEDPGLTRAWIAALIRQIKEELGLAVTLSLGERRPDELAEWRKAGADRYLLRFETSNAELFARIHPARGDSLITNRVAILRDLRELGYEVGSGVMVGIPGQTWPDLVEDLEIFRELDLDMIGIGPFIPHPSTPLAIGGATLAIGGATLNTTSDLQVPATELMTYKMVALARLFCPDSNMPSTTALATLNLAEGRELGLRRGANILMPNLTPPRYRALYEIYPAKACIRETSDQCDGCMKFRIASLGRHVGEGPGASPAWRRRYPAVS